MTAQGKATKIRLIRHISPMCRLCGDREETVVVSECKAFGTNFSCAKVIRIYTEIFLGFPTFHRYKVLRCSK